MFIGICIFLGMLNSVSSFLAILGAAITITIINSRLDKSEKEVRSLRSKLQVLSASAETANMPQSSVVQSAVEAPGAVKIDPAADNNSGVTEAVARNESAPAVQPPPLNSQKKIEYDTQKLILNGLLFTGGLLIVGAAAAFIATSTSSILKAISTWVAVALFYGIGLALYRRNSLRNSAVALMGIGIALVPLSGVVLSIVLDVAPVVSWLIVSIVASVLCAGVAVLVRNETASYITIISVLSLAVSISQNISLEVFWLFIPALLVSIILQAIALYKNNSPGWISRPSDRASVIIPVIVIVLGFFVFEALGYVRFEVLLFLAFVQFFLRALQGGLYEYELVTRLVGSILVMTIGVHLASLNDATATLVTGLTGTFVAAVNILYSGIRKPSLEKEAGAAFGKIESIIATIGLVVLWFVGVTWFFMSNISPYIVALQGVAILLLSLYCHRFISNRGYAYSSIFAAWLLPYTTLHFSVFNGIDWQIVYSMYYFVAAITLQVGYWFVRKSPVATRMYLIVSLVLHVFSALLHAHIGNPDAIVYSYILAIITSVLLARYESKPLLLVVAQFALYLVCTRLLIDMPGTEFDVWIPAMAMILTASMGWIASLLGRRVFDRVPSKVLFVTSLVTYLLGFIVSLTYIGDYRRLALLGVISLVGALAMQLTKYFWHRSNYYLLETSLYTGAVAFLYAVFIFDAAAVLPLAFYAILVGLTIAAAVPIIKNTSREYGNYVMALVVFVVGFMSTWGFAYTHQAESMWGVLCLIGAIAASAVMYSRTKRTEIVEGAYCIVAVMVSYILFIVDFSSVIPWLVYVHIFAIAIFASALLYAESRRRTRFKVALGIVTASSGMYALWIGGIYQLLFLIEHIILLIAAAKYSQKWALIWAVVAIAVAVLYMLRDVSWLILLLAGLGLVGYAISRNNRTPQ